MKRIVVALALALVAAALSVTADAQLRVRPVADESGDAGLGLMLRKLNTAGTFMMATAHPDDENNGLLALLSHGLGMRTVLASATRGDGGQNEIGPELFDALAVLRTEELLAAHRFDGAEQYFTRAVDFGYSFSIEETFKLWGREEILGDYVRLIRTIRPDVIAGLQPDGEGGGQHHQASARLAHEAFRAAADPTRFPEQVKDGLRPWQAKKFYFMAGFGFRGEPPPPRDVQIVSMDVGRYDPLLGRTYAEIGSEARSMHKCQSMPQLLMLPGFAMQAGPGAAARYYLAEAAIRVPGDRAETSLFDGVDATIAGLARFAGADPPPALATGLADIARHAQAAQAAFDRTGATATSSAILAGLAAVRALRAALPSMGGLGDGARDEIDHRLKLKEEQFQEAAILSHRLRLETLADDGLVTPGQPVKVTATVANRGEAGVSVRRIALDGLEGRPDTCAPDILNKDEVFTCVAAMQVPSGAALTAPYFRRLSDAERYAFEPDAPFGAPFRPTPFRATFEVDVGGARLAIARPVEFRYEGDIFSGEKRTELKVVPAFSVRVTPEILIVPASARRAPTGERVAQRGRPVDPRARDVRVTVLNGSKRPAEAEAALETPSGWRVTPATAHLQFTREDESQTVRFTVSPPAGAQAGEHRLRALVRAAGRTFDRGYQVVEYPHIRRRHLVHPAGTRLKVIGVAVAPDLTVGYVAGVGDEVPLAIEQLGARVEFLDAERLAWGDLSAYDVIVTGVRAYERRADLRASYRRLLKYVEDGGTLIVQYNRTEFSEAQLGPYPASVGRERVTDEHAPVRVLVPDHPLFTTPNRIGEAAWKGWVQERGLYFLDERDRDARYVDLVELQDPFENNRGVKRGALVEARHGKGRWIYVGLGLWRQLPAGTDGAYLLLANLLSLGKAPAAAAP